MEVLRSGVASMRHYLKKTKINSQTLNNYIIRGRILKIPTNIWICKLLIFCCPLKNPSLPLLISTELNSVAVSCRFHHCFFSEEDSVRNWSGHTKEQGEPSAGRVSHERLTTMGWICLTNMLWLPIGSGTYSCPGVCAPAVWPDPPLPCFFFQQGHSQNRTGHPGHPPPLCPSSTYMSLAD